jgi:uncharacterized membrane protein
MLTLIIGVLLFAGIHFVPVVARPFRQGLIDKLGNNAYRGLFALAIVAALVLIVLGWRSAPEVYLYVLPNPVKTIGFILICLSLIVIGAAHHPSSIKRYIRHPMLTGVFLWAFSHSLTNGTTRSLVLFGGLGLWALLEIILINRRDGAYEKPEKPEFSEEMKGVFFSAGILIVLLLLHPYFTGVTPFPR